MLNTRTFKTQALTDLEPNPGRRYLAIYAETDVTVDFDGAGITFVIPAGQGKEYDRCVPTNRVNLSGSGTVQEG